RSSGTIGNGDSTPFGLVDPDLKAYLRSAHVTLQEHITAATEEGKLLNKDEDIKALRNAMLDEIKGKELVLATDTDTSVILEDMMSTFGGRQLRILAEALTQQTVTLVCHRFGSHVIQTLLSALQYFAMQDDVKESNEEGNGLRSCQQFIVDISEAIRQQVGDIFGDQFASHVLRSLLLILSGQQATVESVRSKRSKKFHQKTQLTTSRPWSEEFQTHQSVDFKNALGGMLHTLQSTLSDAQKVREMCISPTLSPTIAFIVEQAAKLDTSAIKKGKGTIDFLDASLAGLVSKEPEERSAHIETLLRDSVGSHFLEAVLKVAPHSVVERFWKHYLAGRLGKLGTHPTANFVISGTIRLLDTATLEQACEEVREEGEKLVKARHFGPLIALIERAGQLASKTDPSTVRSVLTAFGISEGDGDDKDGEPAVIDILLKDADAQNGTKEEEPKSAKAEFNLQGSLLCQSILRLSEPAHSPILDNLLESEDRLFLAIACDPIGVHVPLAAVQSSNLPFASRSKLSAKILTLLVPLLSDKFGSRLMDAIFDVSDLFFREKVARACLAAERTLLSTPYGRYFFKRIQIALFRKDVVQWKQHL
ncbi:ARM repeat-containing protein, partial [Meira miltonrushii]